MNVKKVTRQVFRGCVGYDRKKYFSEALANMNMWQVVLTVPEEGATSIEVCHFNGEFICRANLVDRSFRPTVEVAK